MTVLRRSILILDDDPDFLRLLGLWLESEGHDVFASSDPVTGVARLRSRIPDLIISDLRMPVIDGMGILEEAQRLDPDLPVILLTAHGSIPNAVEAMRGNAFG